MYGKLCQLRSGIAPFDNELKVAALTTMTAIDWWQSCWSEPEPELTELCTMALAIMPSTGVGERNWSSHGFIHSKLRNRLGHEVVNRLVYVYWNARINAERRNFGEDGDDASDDSEGVDLGGEYLPDWMR